MKAKLRPVAGLLALAGIPFIPLLFRAESLLAWPGADVSDLVTAHLPASEFIHYSLVHWHQLPLWNPILLSGMPTLGDPITGFAYPPLWLTFFMPTSGSYHLLAWLHLSWAGLGVYKLAKAESLSPAASWLAGLAIALSPRLLGQWGLGHATLLFAFSWTPWVLLSLRRGMSHLPQASPLKWFGLTGGLLGLLTAADPRWSLPAGLTAASYLLVLVIRDKGWLQWRSLLPSSALSLLLLAGSAAFIAVPLLDLLANSARSNLALFAQPQAMPGYALLAAVVPDPSAWPEWSALIGATVFIMAVVGLMAGRRSLFWSGSFAVAAALSLGPATPLWPFLNRWLPGFDLLRMPGRWFLLASMAAAMLAAYGADLLLEELDDQRRRTINLAVVAAAGLVLFLGVARSLAVGSIRSPSGLAALVALMLSLITIVVVVTEQLKAVYLLALVSAELLLLAFTTLQVKPVEHALPEALSAALPAGYGQQRILSTTFRLDQTLAARQRIELANGVHPLVLANYWHYMARTLGFSPEGYSVTLPPFDELAAVEQRLDLIDSDSLANLNIHFLLTASPQDAVGLNEVGQSDGLWLYEVRPRRPRAWVERAGEWDQARVQSWSPNQIELEADGPGVLVLSEIDYPIWRAWVDGAPAQIIAAHEVLRAVELGSGSHSIRFVATAGRAWIGLAASLLSWLVIGALWLKR